VAPILTIIFLKSLSTGEVLADWRTANVMPIFKKGTKSDTGNYWQRSAMLQQKRNGVIPYRFCPILRA
jgi:hypothetical protein